MAAFSGPEISNLFRSCAESANHRFLSFGPSLSAMCRSGGAAADCCGSERMASRCSRTICRRRRRQKMDAFLNLSEPHWYAVFGSGIKDVGPRMPLYRAPASDLTNWTFLGALWEPEKNSTLGSLEETGTYAFNFEVSNFFSIGDRYFVSMGAEGGNVSFHQQKWSLWNEGTLSVRPNGSVAFNPVAGGASDWGLLYAVSTPFLKTLRL